VKSFREFRLDTANHSLWRNGDRVPVAPKGFDVLAYLVEHAGRVVTQDEILEALWSETYVNPEVLRKYIQELRKTLGDRPDNPEFIETLPKRGYRFVASVIDESAAEPTDSPTSLPTEERAPEGAVEAEATSLEQESSSGKRLLWRLANPTPLLPPGMAAWERAAARLSHLLLYALMIALPVTGWIVNSASNVPFRIFWLIPLPAIVAPHEPTADLAAGVHGGLAALLALVLVAHIAAALRHHFVKRNTVLARMLPGTWRTP